MYEIRSSPGKGIGVFASRFIPRGTRIMAEEPLLAFEQPTAIRIYRGFLDLPHHLQETYLRLSYASEAPTSDAVPETERPKKLRKVNSKSNNQSTKTITKSKARTVKHAPSKLDQYATAIQTYNTGARSVLREDLDLTVGARVVAIFHGNAFEHRNATDTHQAFGTFPRAARINHSCVPNAARSWNVRLQRQTVHVLRDVREGEELSVAYVRLLKPRGERMALLRQRGGFECRCPACDVGTEFGRCSDVRRVRLARLDAQLVASLNSGSPHPAEKAMCEELIEVMEMEGIVGWEKGATHATLAELYREQGKMDDAVEEMKKALEISLYCFGSDDVMTIDLEKDLETFEHVVRKLTEFLGSHLQQGECPRIVE